MCAFVRRCGLAKKTPESRLVAERPGLCWTLTQLQQGRTGYYSTQRRARWEMASNAGSTSASTSTSAAPGQGKLAAKKTEVAINDEDDDLDELDDVLECVMPSELTDRLFGLLFSSLTPFTSACDRIYSQFGNAPSASLTGKASSNVTSATADAYDRVQGGDEGKDDGEGDDDDEDFEAVFAAELAKEMEKMLGSVKSSSGNATAGTSGQPSTAAARAGGAKNTNNNDEDGDDDDDGEAETEEERQFRETFEKILASTVKGGGSEDLLNGDEDIDLEELSKLMNGLGGGGGGFPNLAGLGNPGGASSNKGKGRAGAPKAASGPSNPPRTFEESIKATMSRLSESEAAHKDRSRGSGPDGSKDPMAALLAQMEAMGAGGGGLGSALGGPDVDDENLPELLDGLMDQLMSKELLYEPISELKVKVRCPRLCSAASPFTCGAPRLNSTLGLPLSSSPYNRSTSTRNTSRQEKRPRCRRRSGQDTKSRAGSWCRSRRSSRAQTTTTATRSSASRSAP